MIVIPKDMNMTILILIFEWELENFYNRVFFAEDYFSRLIPSNISLIFFYFRNSLTIAVTSSCFPQIQRRVQFIKAYLLCVNQYIDTYLCISLSFFPLFPFLVVLRINVIWRYQFHICFFFIQEQKLLTSCPTLLKKGTQWVFFLQTYTVSRSRVRDKLE